MQTAAGRETESDDRWAAPNSEQSLKGGTAAVYFTEHWDLVIKHHHFCSITVNQTILQHMHSSFSTQVSLRLPRLVVQTIRCVNSHCTFTHVEDTFCFVCRPKNAQICNPVSKAHPKQAILRSH